MTWVQDFINCKSLCKWWSLPFVLLLTQGLDAELTCLTAPNGIIAGRSQNLHFLWEVPLPRRPDGHVGLSICLPPRTETYLGNSVPISRWLGANSIQTGGCDDLPWGGHHQEDKLSRCVSVLLLWNRSVSPSDVLPPLVQDTAHRDAPFSPVFVGNPPSAWGISSDLNFIVINQFPISDFGIYCILQVDCSPGDCTYNSSVSPQTLGSSQAPDPPPPPRRES